jgi:flagellar biosynthesis component FlhA
VEPRRRAISVVFFELTFSFAPFGVLTETMNLLFAFFSLGFKNLLLVIEQTNNQNKEQADKRISKKTQKKKTGKKTAQEQNTNEKHAECDHVKKKKGSEAESLNI